MSERSAGQIQQLKLDLQLANTKCKNIEAEKKQWVEQITALEEQQERTNLTQELQHEEITRLQEGGQGEISMQLDTHKYKTLDARLCNIGQQLTNANMEKAKVS